MKKQLFFIAMLAIISLSVNAQFTKLLDFTGANGSSPEGSLISDGTYLYGTTMSGGGTDIYGTIFKIKKDGTGFTEIYGFDSASSANTPWGDLFSDGTYLYGMGHDGGFPGQNTGAIFKIMPSGSGYDTIMTLFNPNGFYPYGSLISDGTFLYGMTTSGGANNMGVVFKVMPTGGGYTNILDFAGTSNGEWATGSLFYDGTYLYGMTPYGGANNLGVIFKIKPDGSGFAKLLDFAGTSNGANPNGSLISDGTYLYGMTPSGGANGNGNIFKIKKDGTGYADMYDFGGTADGISPTGSLISVGSFLYGMTPSGGVNSDGTIFEIKPDGTGYAKLFDFAGAATGNSPNGSLYSDGTFLYGLATLGGTNDMGTVFKFGLPLGIAGNKLETDFTIYPNPVSCNLTIIAPQKAIIDISTILGQTIKQRQLQQGKTNIDLSEFAKGIYVLRLLGNNNITATKIVKE